jgi:glycerol-3-phosphate dehydrogenase (NAD(P)+)
MRAAVIGGGAWGTALADLLASNGHETIVWTFETDVATAINARHENQRFLQGFSLEPSLRATNELRTALEGAEFLVYATPSHHLRRIAAEGAAFVERDAVLSVATKGIERGTLALMTSVVADEVPASVRPDAARIAQDALSSRTFRVYTNDDVIGVELGGALKNVMAVATGIVEGVGLGNNSRAALITRGLHEMTRLGVALGARAITFAGLAGIGDLVLTCTGLLSRNHALGLEIGRGATLDQALAGKETVAEGVASTASGLALAERCGVDMPIVQMVHRILFDGHTARQAVPELMARELRSEQDL